MLGRKRIFNDVEAREKLIAGANKIALAVTTTLGPWGKMVALQRQYNPPHVTKDGVTVANDIILEDAIENISAQILKEASRKTAKEAGDGTTTTILLANELVKRGFALVDEYGAANVSKSLLWGVEELVTKLKTLSTEISTEEQLKNVALISSNGDEEISTLVTQAFTLLGKEGQVLVRDGNSYNSRVEITKGLLFDKSFPSPVFHKTDGSKSIIKDCRVLVTDLNLNTPQDSWFLISLQESINKPLIVICNDISEVSLEVLVYAYKKGAQVYPMRSPFIAQAKEEGILDISIATGATLLNGKEGYNLDECTDAYLGFAESVEVDYKNTIILPFKDAVDEDLFAARVRYYQEKIMADTDGLKPNYEKRLAMLNSGTAIIYVGGSSEVDIQEKKDRIDDTVCAVRSSLKAGFVVGGGFTYNKLAEGFSNRERDKWIPSLYAKRLLEEVLTAPANKIKENGNIKTLTIDISKVIEPTFVVEQVIRNSVQAAIMIISTGAVVIDVDNEDRTNPLNYAS